MSASDVSILQLALLPVPADYLMPQALPIVVRDDLG